MALELRIMVRAEVGSPGKKIGTWDQKGGSLRRKIQMSTEVPQETNPEEAWFALRVRSRHEKIVATMVHNKGFQEFLPLYPSRRRWSDRLKSVELPLFPGYVFCRLNPVYRLPLLKIPGVQHFVGIGKVPAPIEHSEIASIRMAAQSGLPMEPCSFQPIGQRVLIEDGPLAGIEGVLVGTPERGRVVVSVTLLKRSAAVAIEPQWARPLGESPPAEAFQINPELVGRPSCG